MNIPPNMQNPSFRAPIYAQPPQGMQRQEYAMNQSPMGARPPMYSPGFQPMMSGAPGMPMQFPQQQVPTVYQPQQAPPGQIILTRPTPCKERYAWSPRTEPMKWKLAESIDVEQIVRKGDLQSVEFYMEQFAFANITNDDKKNFGSKGAMNAFLLLQLGCDYLMNQRNTTPLPSTAQPNEQLIRQYHENIAKAEASLKKHREAIQKLESNVSKLKEERKHQKEVIEKLNSRIQKNGKRQHHRKTDTEPGALHDKTLYSEIKKANRKIHKKKANVNTESSDGEIHDDNGSFDKASEYGVSSSNSDPNLDTQKSGDIQEYSESEDLSI